MISGFSPSLLVRPLPIDGESVSGYLIRVASANGMSSVRELWRCSQTLGVAPIDGLKQLLQWTDDHSACLFGPVPSRWGESVLPEGFSPQDFLHNHRRRWCPQCMAEAGFQRGVWDLKLVTVCTKHALRLRDRCPACGDYQRWSASSLVRCTCGSELCHGEADIPSPDEVTLTRALEGTTWAESFVVFDVPAALSQREWLNLVRVIGQFSIDHQPSRPGQISQLDRIEVASRVVVGAAQLLHEWPASFQQMVSAIQQRAGPTLSLKTAFGVLYRLLYCDRGAPSYQFLRDAFEAHLQDHWWGVMCRRNRSLGAATVANQARMTARQASRDAGVAPSVMKRLVQQELLTVDDVPLPSGRTARAVRQADVQTAAALVEGSMNLQQLANHAHLPERRIRELVANGVITPLISRTSASGLPASWLFGADVCQRLVVPTRLASAPDASSVMLANLFKFGRLRPGEASKVVKAILEGAISARSADAAPTPIGIVLVNRAEILAWRRECMDAAGESMSVPEAARLMSLKEQVVYELISRGLIATTPGPGGDRQISRAAIAAFNETYVSMAELARTHKTSPRAMLRRLEVRPATGPEIDGARQYFVRRDQIEGAAVYLPKIP